MLTIGDFRHSHYLEMPVRFWRMRILSKAKGRVCKVFYLCQYFLEKNESLRKNFTARNTQTILQIKVLGIY